MINSYYVYILCSKTFGTLYTGVTNNIIRRTYEHKNKTASLFTARYNVNRLAYYEIHESIEAAIIREKRIKRWPRSFKINLINQSNQQWKDLYYDLF